MVTLTIANAILTLAVLILIRINRQQERKFREMWNENRRLKIELNDKEGIEEYMEDKVAGVYFKMFKDMSNGTLNTYLIVKPVQFSDLEPVAEKVKEYYQNK